MGVEFRWYSGESDLVPIDPGPPRRTRRLMRWLALSGLALILAAVGVVYWQSQRGLRAARADLQRVVDQEVLALQSGERDSFLSLLDARYAPWVRYHRENFQRESAWYAAHPGVRACVESVSLGPDLAAARVRLRDGRGSQTESAVWYFRRVRGQWLHAPPAPDAGSAPAEVKTAHLSLVGQVHDREALAAAAPDLEILYLELDRLYLPARQKVEANDAGTAGTASRLTVHVQAYGSAPGEEQTIPSPELAVDLWTRAERRGLLVRSARVAVARAVLNHCLRRTRPCPADWWLLEGLALWHAAVWQPEWLRHVQSSLADGSFTSLLAAGGGAGAAPDLERAQALAYTLGAYLAGTYSPERMPALLGAMGRCGSSWSALRAVLGLSRADLEAEWAAYIRQHYEGC